MTKKNSVQRPVHIWNQRMLDLMKYCIYKGVVNSEKDFLTTINFPSQNLTHIKKGSQSFTHHQFFKASKIYNVDMNWFYGLTNIMEKTKDFPTAAELIKAALSALEQDNKKARPRSNS